MYAIGHTSHSLITLTAKSEANVRAKFKNFKRGRNPSLFGRCRIRGETWSFFEQYGDAKGFQALLFLDGAQG